MKRSGFSKPGKTLQRKKPMNPGTAQLARTGALRRSDKPMAPVGQRARRTGQGKVPPTAIEQVWMDAAAKFGCIVCWLQQGAKKAAEIHHMKAGDRRRGHLYTLPLCYAHHRGGAGAGQYISRHPWKKRFETTYGTEIELLAACRALLGYGEHPTQMLQHIFVCEQTIAPL
jgi:hypothetical protein